MGSWIQRAALAVASARRSPSRSAESSQTSASAFASTSAGSPPPSRIAWQAEWRGTVPTATPGLGTLHNTPPPPRHARAWQGRVLVVPPALKPAANAVPQGTPVRVKDNPVQRGCPQPLRGCEGVALMWYHPSGRSGSGAASLVPRGELVGLPEERREGLPRIQEVCHVIGAAVKVLAPQPEAEVPGERARSVPQASWVAGLPGIPLRVQHGDRQLAVVAPRPPVEVVRPDHRPHVVDDHHLGVHVHRCSLVVLQVKYGETLAARGGAGPHHVVLAKHRRHLSDRAVLVGMPGHNGDDMQVGVVAQGRGDDVGYPPRPQVLVLQVDQAAGPREHLPVRVRDAPLPERRERVPAEAGRIGAQHLDGVRTPPGLVGCQRLRKRPARHRTHVIRAVVELAEWTGQVKDAAAVPALPEGVLEVMHGWATYLGLDVVPGRPRAVGVGEFHHLRVAGVLRVVIAAVTQVDPPDERDVARRIAGTTHHDQLLVMAAPPAGPGIEQNLTAVLVDLPDKLRVGLLGLLHHLGL